MANKLDHDSPMFRCWLTTFSLLVATCIGAQAQSVSVKQFNQYIQSLPNATTPLNNADQFYVLQNGVSKKVPSSSLPTGSGTVTGTTGNIGAANLTRAQIPSTNLTGISYITLNGYATAGDSGYGATYTSVGANCTSGLEYIRDSASNCFNLVITDTVEPGWFGAPANDGGTVLTALDPGLNPQWRGTYTAGMTWDYVGTQEAVYAAFAGGSTPGSIVWNNVAGNTALNKKMFIPCGRYGLNSTVNVTAQGWSIEAAGRQCALFDWVGSRVNETAWYFNSGSYGLAVNFSVACTIAQSYGSQNGCIKLDYNGAPGGLKTQQLTFINLWMNVGSNGQGFALNPVSGGSGQGDTITFINPYAGGDFVSSDFAFLIDGSNALQSIFIGGDCQGFPHNCIIDAGGVHYSYGMHFENQNTDQGFQFAPLLNQVVTGGADVNAVGGNSGNGTITLADARSEASILLQARNGSIAQLYNGKVTESDPSDWFATDDFEPGYYVMKGTATPRPFILVDNGGFCSQWCPITSSTANTITDNTASYTPGALVNLVVWRRFGSNGFVTRKCIVTDNTATTITFTNTVDCPATSSESMYMLAARTGLLEPSWDSATPAVAGSNSFQRLQTEAGSNCIAISSNYLSIGDWLIIPYADQVAPASGAVWPNALYAQVTGTGVGNCVWGGLGANNVTVNKIAGRSTDTGQGGSYPTVQFYHGQGLADGSATWLQVPFDAVSGVRTVMSFEGKHGLLYPTPGPKTLFNIIYDPANKITNPLDGTSFDVGNAQDYSTNYLAGSLGLVQCIPTVSATIDLTDCIASGSVITIIPTSNTTINAPAVNRVDQLLFVILKTNGNNYTVTFGNNFITNGPVHTGTTNNQYYVLTFMQNNRNGTDGWVEVARSIPQTGAGSNAVVAAPAGPNSTVAATMQGLAGAITPTRTGNVMITINGTITSSVTTAGDGITNQISYGIGAAPTSNAALTGTQAGSVQTYLMMTTPSLAADVSQPFSLSAVVTGLTPGTGYWIDLASRAVVATGAANSALNISAHEF